MKKYIFLLSVIWALFAAFGCSHNFNRNNPVDPVIPPDKPTLSSPTDTSTGISVNPIFTWIASEYATSYTLQVTTNAACTSFVYNQSGIVLNSDTVTGLSYATIYYWRVRADKKDNCSDWTGTWSFTTTSATAPIVTTDAILLISETTAQLKGTVNPNNDATTYYFQYGLTTSYGTNTATQNAGSGNSAVAAAATISGLTPGTTYHYRIAATNSGGTSYGNDCSFITVPGAPVLLLPANNAIGIALSPTLSWYTDSGATSYTLQVSTSNTFVSFVYNQSGLTGISQTVSGLDTATVYYWRVNATNSNISSEWSSIWQFTTISNPVTAIVWVSIPAGNFLMGSTATDTVTWLCPNEYPQHTVYLDAYQISKYEITNAQFKVFMDSGGYSNSIYWTTDGWSWRTANSITEPYWWSSGSHHSGVAFPNHPVVGVSWYEAYAYSQWAGGHLPTEAQWEKAARGTDARYWPWGSTWDASRCNSYDDVLPDTFNLNSSPVGFFTTGTSPYGVFDMAGNVWEWVNDWYQSDYYSTSPGSNPTGPTTGTTCVLRGGSWGDQMGVCRSVYRRNKVPEYRTVDAYGTGFRPVK